MSDYQINENDRETRSWKADNDNWAVGIALILVGGLFMLDTMGIIDIRLTNWWAIFILIPGLNMVFRGWRHFQASQSHHGRNTAFWGMMLIVLAFTLFFNVSWELIFPAGLIGAGLYLLFFR